VARVSRRKRDTDQKPCFFLEVAFSQAVNSGVYRRAVRARWSSWSRNTRERLSGSPLLETYPGPIRIATQSDPGGGIRSRERRSGDIDLGEILSEDRCSGLRACRDVTTLRLFFLFLSTHFEQHDHNGRRTGGSR
jgi:hypothetical protein